MHFTTPEYSFGDHCDGGDHCDDGDHCDSGDHSGGGDGEVDDVDHL